MHLLIPLLFLLAGAATFATGSAHPLVHLAAGAAWTLVCLAAVTKSSGTRARILWFNAGAVIAVVTLVETYAVWTDPSAEGPNARLVSSNPDPLLVPDEVLGYRHASSYSTSMRFYFDEELIFDARYTTDAFGLRLTPPPAAAGERRCILFFGDSFAFGAGVDDTEAMPYLVGVRTGGRYHIRNFAVGGYGPNQMLAAIESGFVERAAACDAVHAVYLAIPHHAMRAVGKWQTEQPGPRYVLRGDDVVRDGRFELPDDVGEPGWLEGRSPLWNRLLGDNPGAIHLSADDVELFHRIVARSGDLLAERYPGISFHVLYWDIGDPGLFGDDSVPPQIPVHRLSSVLPRDTSELDATFLIPHDGHPNARAHRLMADYVIEEIL